MLRYLFPLALLVHAAAAVPSAPVRQMPAFLPAPLELVLGEGDIGFALGEGIRIDVATSHSPMGRALIRSLMAADLPVLPEEAQGDVCLRITEGENPERYELEVTSQGITIAVNDAAALPLVAQTLAQALVKDACGAPAIPAMRIKDCPLFAHRGLMLDCARHPLPVADIRKMLRVMARYKLNRLHWHLTDDQGWRLEIRAYPKLTQVGNYRPASAIYPDNGQLDGVPVEMFYTQDEVRELVRYAQTLGIVIIPEIDIPGHASAAIASYPELGNADAPGFKPEVATTWGVFPTVLAPNDATFRFLSVVLAETCELFPNAPYIHCGGDECPRTQWRQSAVARAFMQEQGMREPAEIQHFFTRFCASELARHGRRMVGWDEIRQASELPSQTIVMAWHGSEYEQVVRDAARTGHDVIASPDTWCYLNFGHKVWAKTPFYRAYEGSIHDWEQSYSFNPVPAGLAPGEARHIIGVQGNAWGEVIPNAHKLEYMVFPRLLALAEVAWLPAEKRDAADFRRRLMAQYPYLDRAQVNFRQEDGTPRRESPGR